MDSDLDDTERDKGCKTNVDLYDGHVAPLGSHHANFVFEENNVHPLRYDRLGGWPHELRMLGLSRNGDLSHCKPGQYPS